MLPSLKIENPISAADTPGTAAHTRYLWGGGGGSSDGGGGGGGGGGVEVSMNRPETRNPGTAAFEAPLSYTRPERLNRNESFFSPPSPRSQITSGVGVPIHPSQDLPVNSTSSSNIGEHDRTQEVAMKRDFDDQSPVLAEEQKYVDIESLSSDGRAEKKKMKRFRLTHNQTRFLMSEFTRQAHPDAAHRERLSREIPGLSPRQVQVWFQNRRAKLKRLTGNDRERMLKSRALPEDFDTSQVLRSPFDGKSSPETVLPSPRNFMSPNPNPNSLKMLLTDGLPRAHGDEYVVSPLSSASAYISPATPDRNPEHFPPSAAFLNRASLSAPVTNLQRSDHDTFSFSRSNSCSEAYAQQQQQQQQQQQHPVFGHRPHPHDRFPRTHSESFGHPGLPPMQRAVEYGMNRPPSGVVGGYDNRQQLESPVVSPTGPTGHASVPYGMHSPANVHMQGYQQHLSMPAAKPTTIGGLEMDSQTSQKPHNRHLSTLKSIPVSSDPPPYRPLPYHHHPYSINTAMTTFGGQATNGLSTSSFHPSDAGNAAPPSASSVNIYNPTDERMNHAHAHAQIVDPSRSNPSFEYPSYM